MLVLVRHRQRRVWFFFTFSQEGRPFEFWVSIEIRMFHAPKKKPLNLPSREKRQPVRWNTRKIQISKIETTVLSTRASGFKRNIVEPKQRLLERSRVFKIATIDGWIDTCVVHEPSVRPIEISGRELLWPHVRPGMRWKTKCIRKETGRRGVLLVCKNSSFLTYVRP